MKFEKVVVTGGTDFLGSRLVERLKQKGKQVVVFDNFSCGFKSAWNLAEIKGRCKVVVDDILNFELVKKIINENVTTVYHFAAFSSHRLILKSSHDYAMINLVETAKILKAIRLCRQKPLLVLVSSNEVYGKQRCPWCKDKLP